MNYLTHKIKIELNRCNEVMYLHLKIDIEESALKTNDVGGNDGRYKDRRIRIRTNSRKENRGINGKVLHKKKEFGNFVKSTDNIHRDLEDGRKGRCHGSRRHVIRYFCQ